MVQRTADECSFGGEAVACRRGVDAAADGLEYSRRMIGAQAIGQGHQAGFQRFKGGGAGDCGDRCKSCRGALDSCYLGIAPVGEMLDLVGPVSGFVSSITQAACCGWPAAGINCRFRYSAALAVLIRGRFQQGGNFG